MFIVLAGLVLSHSFRSAMLVRAIHPSWESRSTSLTVTLAEALPGHARIGYGRTRMVQVRRIAMGSLNA